MSYISVSKLIYTQFKQRQPPIWNTYKGAFTVLLVISNLHYRSTHRELNSRPFNAQCLLKSLGHQITIQYHNKKAWKTNNIRKKGLLTFSLCLFNLKIFDAFSVLMLLSLQLCVEVHQLILEYARKIIRIFMTISSKLCSRVSLSFLN